MKKLICAVTVLAFSTGAVSSTPNFALQFDGDDDYVAIPDAGDFDFDETFTVEAWVKPASLLGSEGFKGIVQGAFSEPPFSGSGWVMFLHSLGYSNWGLSVSVPNSNAASSGSGGLVVGQWQHLAGTFDGTTITIYWNGVLADSTLHQGNVSDVNVVLMGIWETAFDGIIDEVRIWNVARSQPEIQATMNVTLTGSEPGLVGYWPLDEGTGQVVVDLSTKWPCQRWSPRNFAGFGFG